MLQSQVLSHKCMAKEAYSRGMFLEAASQYEEAIFFATMRRELDPSAPATSLALLYWSRAAACIMLGAFDEATVACSQANSVDRGFVKVFPRMAKAYMKSGDLGESDATYLQGMSSTKDSSIIEECMNGRKLIRRLQQALQRCAKLLLENSNRRGWQREVVNLAADVLEASPNNIEAQDYMVQALLSSKMWDVILCKCREFAMAGYRCRNGPDGIAPTPSNNVGLVQMLEEPLRLPFCKAVMATREASEFEEVIQISLDLSGNSRPSGL
ncbi:unnamed protein product, partial [Discosporangium mesarthrocarpum]